MWKGEAHISRTVSAPGSVTVMVCWWTITGEVGSQGSGAHSS